MLFISPSDHVIPPFGIIRVNTGICVELPNGTYGRVADKSSISFFEHLHILGGVIDSDYRGPIMVLVHNFNDTSYIMLKGDKIAQLIVEKIYNVRNIVECNVSGFHNW
jgi:deoxyuridine 5'-triphosphate nucleotidohydrolase